MTKKPLKNGSESVSYGLKVVKSVGISNNLRLSAVYFNVMKEINNDLQTAILSATNFSNSACKKNVSGGGLKTGLTRR